MRVQSPTIFKRCTQLAEEEIENNLTRGAKKNLKSSRNYWSNGQTPLIYSSTKKNVLGGS